MTADERAAAERLEAWLKPESKEAIPIEDLYSLLAALRRNESLANEGLTEDERLSLKWFRETYGQSHGAVCAVEKMLATNAELRQFRDLFVGNGWGDDVRAQTVEHETAKEAMTVGEQAARLRYGGTMTEAAAVVLDAICRRFNISAPQVKKASTVLANSCERCGGTGSVEVSKEPCSTAMMDCRVCSGTGRKGERPTTPWDICHDCRGTGYARYCDASGDMDDRTCTTCGGTGRVVT